MIYSILSDKRNVIKINGSHHCLEQHKKAKVEVTIFSIESVNLSDKIFD